MSYNNIVGSNYEGFDTDEVKIPPNLIGIYFTNYAQATITHNKVSGNICILPDNICGPDWFTQFQAAGIGFCNKSFFSSTTLDDSPINTQQENFNITQNCPFINGTIPNGLFIASEIDVQQENSNELDSSLMPIQTIHNHINTNVAVNAAGPDSSIISNNYVSNNYVGISITGEQNGCCVIDYNKLTDNRFFGIVIADGEHKVSNTKIFGGEVEAAAIATNANTTATLDNVKIVDTEIPVQALSSGEFTAAVNVVSPYFFAP